MGSWDRRMSERGENQREKKGGGASCLEKLDSQVCICLSEDFRVGPKQSGGDYGRSEETLCHPTRCPSPLFPPSPSLSCQHKHPVHTHGSCRNYGSLCYKDTVMQEHPGVSFLKGHLHNLLKVQPLLETNSSGS